MEKRRSRERRKRRKQAERKVFLGTLIIFLFAAGITAFAMAEKGGTGKNIGNVAFEVTEPQADRIMKNLKTEFICLKPGQTIIKDPTVMVKKHSGTAYLRARLIYSGLDMIKRKELEAHLELKEGWVKNDEDGYFYYQYPVEAEERVCFFSRITIPESWDRKVEVTQFCFEVDVEAAEVGKIELVKDQDQKIVGWYKDF